MSHPVVTLSLVHFRLVRFRLAQVRLVQVSHCTDLLPSLEFFSFFLEYVIYICGGGVQRWNEHPDNHLLSVPKCTANLYCIYLSIYFWYTQADEVQICGKFRNTQEAHASKKPQGQKSADLILHLTWNTKLSRSLF